MGKVTHLRRGQLMSTALCGRRLSGKYKRFTEDIPSCPACFVQLLKLIEIAEEEGDRENGQSAS